MRKLTEHAPARLQKALEFQMSIDERFNLGGVRGADQADEEGITIACDIRREAGFSDDEIDRLVQTTQRSPVY
jgi:hypothetical protein